MVIVISHPDNIAHEADYINALFNNGLEVFHLRKPLWPVEEYKSLLNSIDSTNYSKIAIHHHHDISNSFKIQRLHFTEEARMDQKNLQLNNGFIYSTSIHSDTDLSNIFNVYEYCFYGPLFDSISKPGYKKITCDKSQLIRSKYPNKLIAIGGINNENVSKVRDAGYDGVALLGSIWSNPEKAVDEYLKIKSTWNTQDQ